MCLTVTLVCTMFGSKPIGGFYSLELASYLFIELGLFPKLYYMKIVPQWKGKLLYCSLYHPLAQV